MEYTDKIFIQQFNDTIKLFNFLKALYIMGNTDMKTFKDKLEQFCHDNIKCCYSFNEENCADGFTWLNFSVFVPVKIVIDDEINETKLTFDNYSFRMSEKNGFNGEIGVVLTYMIENIYSYFRLIDIHNIEETRRYLENHQDVEHYVNSYQKKIYRYGDYFNKSVPFTIKFCEEMDVQWLMDRLDEVCESFVESDGNSRIVKFNSFDDVRKSYNFRIYRDTITMEELQAVMKNISVLALKELTDLFQAMEKTFSCL